MKNVLNCNQFTKTDLKEIFDLADVVRANPKKYVKALDGKVITTLFLSQVQEPDYHLKLLFKG